MRIFDLKSIISELCLEHLPSFRPIIDTIGTTHYEVGKYLCELLTPLASKEFSLKDSFDAADRIRHLPKNYREQGYKLVSFDVVSLFTNVPLQRKINIILDCVYKNKEISTTLKRSCTLKKVLLETCTKTAFQFNNTFY